MMKKLHSDIILTDNEFARISRLIYQRAGIVLSDNKKEMVYNRLFKRIQQTHHSNFTEYLSVLEMDHNNPEWETFVNALTTNLTAFFRENHHFKTLADHAKQQMRPYKVWCCAASTGEEPYSIAITLADALGCSASHFQIWATDIDTQVLNTAKAGIYKFDSVIKTVSKEQLHRYFLKGGPSQRNLVKVRPELASCIHFSTLNLLNNDWAIPGSLDAIFCRNVMIYFDRPTQERLLNRFVPLLKKDGLLFAGHSENINQITDKFKLERNTVYRVADE